MSTETAIALFSGFAMVVVALALCFVSIVFSAFAFTAYAILWTIETVVRKIWSLI